MNFTPCYPDELAGWINKLMVLQSRRLPNAPGTWSVGTSRVKKVDNLQIRVLSIFPMVEILDA
jgi:hypothetical protein